MAGRSTLLMTVAVAAMLLAIGHCQKAQDYKLSDKCKTCIENLGITAGNYQWKAVENCLYWTPFECKLMKEHKEAVMGVFMARMNPYSYASGYCLASDCEEPQEVDITPLKSLPVLKLIANVPEAIEAVASLDDNSAVDQENDVTTFLANDKEVYKCPTCSAKAYAFLSLTVVPALLEDLCDAGKRDPNSLVSYVKSLMCSNLQTSKAATLSYFAVVDNFANGAYGACTAVGCGL